MSCRACGYRKEKYYLCESCKKPICHQCINEGLCTDCYVEISAKIEQIENEYLKEKKKWLTNSVS